jgi:hypothetical protein
MHPILLTMLITAVVFLVIISARATVGGLMEVL